MSLTVPADMHTHQPGQGEYFLLSVNGNTAAKYCSREFHPWHLPEKFVPLTDEFLEELKSCSALGEIGLDRLRGPDLMIQRRYLDVLLEAAQHFSLPVVIHNVRCESEILSALRGFPNAVLFHGFRGGGKALEKLLDAGYFVSFSEISNVSMAAYLKANGLHNTGIESDDTGISITDIADGISRCLDIDVTYNSINTFKRFLAI
ncbi:MAG: TatD family hydrolase [Lentisphaeria bacterium]|nr:TatD family hydrolase [Lentisphaeria bacterium]